MVASDLYNKNSSENLIKFKLKVLERNWKNFHIYILNEDRLWWVKYAPESH